MYTQREREIWSYSKNIFICYRFVAFCCRKQLKNRPQQTAVGRRIEIIFITLAMVDMTTPFEKVCLNRRLPHLIPKTAIVFGRVFMVHVYCCSRDWASCDARFCEIISQASDWFCGSRSNIFLAGEIEEWCSELETAFSSSLWVRIRITSRLVTLPRRIGIKVRLFSSWHSLSSLQNNFRIPYQLQLCCAEVNENTKDITSKLRSSDLKS